MNQSSPTNSHFFKLLVVGDAKVGKTCFVQKFLTDHFETKYVPTLGCEYHSLDFATNRGEEILFNCWDTAGREKYKGLDDGYYVLGQAAIIMFDVTNRDSFAKVVDLHKNIVRICGSDIPVALCGNKVDNGRDRQVMPKEISDFLHHQKINNMQYFDISARSNYNIEKPLLWLARKLRNDDGLIFVPKASSLTSSDNNNGLVARIEKELENNGGNHNIHLNEIVSVVMGDSDSDE